MKKTLALLLFIFGGSIHPCMNEYEEINGITKPFFEPNGYIDETSADQQDMYTYIVVNMYKLDELEKEASDIAIAYLYLKNYKRGLQITNKLIKKYPEEYNVVITHAVALELNGKPDEALIYLKKAVEINPESHWGSEWIHVNILEIIASKKDLKGISTLGLNFGNDSIPSLKDTTIDISKTLEQLEFQLEDRKFFIEEKNAIYGSMLFDYGNLLYLNGDTMSCIHYFNEAKSYGYDHPALNSRIKYLDNWIISTAEVRNKKYADQVHKNSEKYVDSIPVSTVIFMFLGLISIFVIVIAFVWILLRKKNA